MRMQRQKSYLHGMITNTDPECCRILKSCKYVQSKKQSKRTKKLKPRAFLKDLTQQSPTSRVLTSPTRENLATQGPGRPAQLPPGSNSSSGPEPSSGLRAAAKGSPAISLEPHLTPSSLTTLNSPSFGWWARSLAELWTLISSSKLSTRSTACGHN